MYHLMDLEPGEERLVMDEEGATSSSPLGRLLRSSFTTLGNGVRTTLKNDHKAGVKTPLVGPPWAPDKTTGHAFELASTQNPIRNAKTLSDLCRILRSKNAGPYEITIDAIFYSESDYRSIKETNLLSSTSVAKALGVPLEDIIWMGFFDPALAFKVTIPRVRSGRKKSAGGFMENDVHGSQEHLGLASLELPQRSTSVLASDPGTQWLSVRTIAVAAFGAAAFFTLRRALTIANR
jgi:hypothetical protein